MSTSTCVPSHPRAMRAGAVPKPLHLHLGCPDLCLGILPRLSSSHFPASAEHPAQPRMAVPRSAPPTDASPVRCRPSSACRRTRAHPPTLYACSSSSGVSLDTCHFYYFSSRGFPAHACPETRSALLPTQAGLQSGSRPAPSVPAEDTGVARGRCLALWQLVPGLPADAASTDPASPAGSTVKSAERMSLSLCWGHKAPGSHPGWDPGDKAARSSQWWWCA